MSILKKLLGKKKFDEYVYKHTTKPKQYVHIDEPRSLQEHRQVQYNNWCKRKGVYNGSYLPEDPNVLGKKGWRESKGKPDGTARFFNRKSNDQKVRYDVENEKQFAHWHWLNGNSDKERRSKPYKRRYLDRYGKECSKNGKAHHLAPLDKDYIEKDKKQ